MDSGLHWPASPWRKSLPLVPWLCPRRVGRCTAFPPQRAILRPCDPAMVHAGGRELKSAWLQPRQAHADRSAESDRVGAVRGCGRQGCAHLRLQRHLRRRRRADRGRGPGPVCAKPAELHREHQGPRERRGVPLPPPVRPRPRLPAAHRLFQVDARDRDRGHAAGAGDDGAGVGAGGQPALLGPLRQRLPVPHEHGRRLDQARRDAAVDASLRRAVLPRRRHAHRRDRQPHRGPARRYQGWGGGAVQGAAAAVPHLRRRAHRHRAPHRRRALPPPQAVRLRVPAHRREHRPPRN
mmetsp:Transcript_47000/g.110688  ORF Transcript_47000/g.110688 Transcript_47000/m.110688 type:complete len:294 (-) Transcript_47000:3615-4496(-)